MKKSILSLFLICSCFVGNSQITLPVYQGVFYPKDVVVVTCTVKISPSVSKEFMCHNLGADTTLDPNVPVQGIHGNYYQWGRSVIVADASTPAAAIVGWNLSPGVNGAWSDDSKTSNDPFPVGFRVPTNVQWDGVVANNTVSRTGSWENDANFTTAIHWGPDAATKALTLPAAGYRERRYGALISRGSYGYYWSSTTASTSPVPSAPRDAAAV